MEECEECGTPRSSGIEHRINKKIMDLQTQLLRHYAEDGFILNENDLLRYSAMIDVLKAMLS